MESYYILMKLLSSQLEYLPHDSFHSSERNNMISWLAARCDFPNTGRCSLRTSQEKLIYGPNANRGDDRSEHDDRSATDPLGPKRVESHSWKPDRGTDRELLSLCGAAVPHGRGHGLPQLKRVIVIRATKWRWSPLSMRQSNPSSARNNRRMPRKLPWQPDLGQAKRNSMMPRRQCSREIGETSARRWTPSALAERVAK